MLTSGVETTRTREVAKTTMSQQTAPLSMKQVESAIFLISMFRLPHLVSHRFIFFNLLQMGAPPGMFVQPDVDNMSYEQLLEAFGDGQENRSRGIGEDVIRGLPVSVFEGEDSKPSATSGKPSSTHWSTSCPICLEDYAPKESSLISLPCFHTFHVACGTKWLKEGDGGCPICKAPVVKQEAEE